MVYLANRLSKLATGAIYLHNASLDLGISIQDVDPLPASSPAGDVS